MRILGAQPSVMRSQQRAFSHLLSYLCALLKESLHIISEVIFYYEMNRISPPKHRLMMINKSRNDNHFKELLWGLTKDNYN